MSSEVKRYDSVGYDGLSSMMEEHPEGDYVRAEDYDALRAQLAAIQGGMGERNERKAFDDACWHKKGGAVGNMYPAEAAEWAWFECASQHQRITAAMAAELAELKECLSSAERQASQVIQENHRLRAELAEVKGREAVATIEQREPYEDGTPNPGKALRWAGNNAEDDLPAGTKLYALPPASPDVEGLVKALEWISSNGYGDGGSDCAAKADDALSTWRQAHTPSTLPASSAEE